MDISLIYSLGEKIAEACKDSGGLDFFEFLRSDCFRFVAAVVIASIIEAISLDFLFTGKSTTSSSGTGSASAGGRETTDYADSQHSKPASTLAEIWGTSVPGDLTLQDVVGTESAPPSQPDTSGSSEKITLEDIVNAATDNTKDGNYDENPKNIRLEDVIE
jgi:hypothetical protein